MASTAPSVKNTLFRFNTLRSPQLIKTEKRDRTCIEHPNPSEGSFFSEQINSPQSKIEDQLNALKERAYTYESFVSINALKAFMDRDFNVFSDYLAANGQAIYEKKDGYFEQAGVLRVSLRSDQPLKIWDELFYQMITNEQPAMRELLIQALVAENFAQKWEHDWVHETALASVVIPTGFYGITDGSYETTGTDSTATSNVHTHELKKASEAAIAKSNAEQYKKAAAEFAKAEKLWQKENQQAFGDAKKAYDEELKSIIGEVTNGGTDPEGNPFMQNMNIEPFAYTPVEQVNPSTLASRVSAQANFIAAKMGLYSLNSFEEIYQQLEAESRKEADKLFESASLSARALDMGNGIIIPVDNGPVPTPPSQQYTYVVKPIQLEANKYKLLVVIQMGYSNADAVYASYDALIGSTHNLGKAFNDQAIRQNLSVELYPDGVTIPSTTTSFNLSGEIQTRTGITLTFDTPVSVLDGASGTMTSTGTNTNGDGGAGTGSDTNGGNDQDDTYVPAGFGIRRLGITDYRKVEQSVCCYVPGEVSHIENVMASEYKERSTRRLRRTEDTITTETQTEKENLTDTTSTDRYELQQEISSVVNENTSTAASANAGFSKWGVTVGASASFAHNVSQQDSNRQAVNYAKEVTEKALERVVQKVRQERVTKMVDEFEEQNKHGFDNRKGIQHVSGVYRWVDKIYKNQVFNYGKRLMYEFMVPQPAIFHTEAMKNLVGSSAATVIEKPIDPRSDAAGLHKISSHKDITTANYSHWAGAYKAEVEAPPVKTRYIGKSFATKATAPGAFSVISDGSSDMIKIPEGYKTISAKVQLSGMPDGETSRGKGFGIGIGDLQFNYPHINTWAHSSDELYLREFVEEIPFAVQFCSFHSGQATVSVKLELLPEFLEQWQISTFNAIMEGYENKLSAYLESTKTATETNKAVNPGFYRQIESTVLRKNCVTYLTSNNKLGKKWYSGNNVGNLQPVLSTAMDRYASLAKFIEDAFEWDTMGYSFLPFYWGDRNLWQSMYQQEVGDSLFRSFLQAGFAKVIISVRPGFEQAVMHYMATGQIWNGGQVPVIGDDLYLSIVDELKNPTYYVDETWETRVPSTLTVIQASSIGLNSTGLPCDCGDDTGIANNDAVLAGAELP
jgi:hypothetical protein